MQEFCDWKRLFEKKKEEMNWFKLPGTQIITLYNPGEQKSISACTKHLRWMGYNFTRPCRVSVLAAKNRNLGLSWARTDPN